MLIRRQNIIIKIVIILIRTAVWNWSKTAIMLKHTRIEVIGGSFLSINPAYEFVNHKRYAGIVISHNTGFSFAAKLSSGYCICTNDKCFQGLGHEGGKVSIWNKSLQLETTCQQNIHNHFHVCHKWPTSASSIQHAKHKYTQTNFFDYCIKNTNKQSLSLDTKTFVSLNLDHLKRTPLVGKREMFSWLPHEFLLAS